MLLMTPPAEYRCQHCNATNPTGLERCFTCGGTLDGAEAVAYSAALAGRQEWMRQLDGPLAAVREQRACYFLLVEGEAGVGKSRMLRETIARLSREGEQVISGRAYADKQGTRYWLIHDLLAHFFAFSPELDAGQRRDRVQERLHQMLSPTVARRTALPLLYLLKLTTEAEQRTILASDAEARAEQLFRACQALLVVATDERPLVALVDDAQWLDADSAELLAALLRRRSLFNLLFVLWSRPPAEERLPIHRLLEEVPVDDRLVLPPLQRDAAEHYLAGLLRWPTPPSELADAVLERAQGNPFLIEELTRHLVERGILVEQDEGWRLDRPVFERATLVPQTVRETVHERMAALPEAARLQLEIAAVIGIRLERVVLRQAVSPLVEQWSEEGLDQNLALLLRRGFLRGEGAERLRFEHNLVQETLIEGMEPARRTQYHAQVAQALELLYPSLQAPVVARLARHYSLADDADRAILYLSRALEQSSDVAAAEHALLCLHHIHDRFPATLAARPDLYLSFGRLLCELGRYDRARPLLEAGLTHVSGADEAQFHCEIGVLLQARGEYDEAEQVFERALQTVDGRDTLLRARILSEFGWVLFRRGRLEEAESYFEEALALLPFSQPKARAPVLNRMAGIAYQRGDVHRSRARLERAMDALAEAGDLLGMAHGHNNLGSIAVLTHDLDAAIHHREEALRLYERLGNLKGLCSALINYGQFYAMVGRFDRARPLLERGLTLARESEQRYEEVFALWSLGAALGHEGDGDAARRMLEEAMAAAKALGSTQQVIESGLRLAEVCLDLGNLDEAALLLDGLAAQQPPSMELQATVLRLQAWRLLEEARVDEARDAIRMSLDLLQNCPHDPVCAVMTEAEYVRVLLRLDDTEGAATRRAAAIERWQESVLPHTPLPPRAERRWHSP